MTSSSLANEPLFPADSVPEDRTQAYSPACAVGCAPNLGEGCGTAVRALAIKGFMVQLLAAHFADPDNISDNLMRDTLRNFPYTTDAMTGLLISTDTTWKPNSTEIRPGILVKRNEWQWTRKLPGDFSGQDYITGAEEYFGFIAGSYSLFAMAREGAEAEVLAHELARCVLIYGPIILDQLRLDRLQLMSVGAVGQIQESGQYYGVQVPFAYMIQEAWKLEPHAPRLKRLSIKTSGLLV